MRDSIAWLTKHKRDDELSSISNVLEFRLRAASAAYRTNLDLENVEELFSLASAAGPASLAADVQRAIAATIDYCTATSPTLCERTRSVALLSESPLLERLDRKLWPRLGREFGYADGVEGLAVSDFVALLGALTGQLSEPTLGLRNTFVSFNYDLLVEQSLTQIGKTISYGIPPQRFTADATWMAHDGAPLLKLHGSVNWAFTGGPGIRLTGFGEYAELLKADIPPVLVPPTWRKEFAKPLGDVWDSALEALRTATRIIVIGFSMPITDQHFRYLLAAGLRDNISLRNIVLVDPQAQESVKQRALQILRPELADRGAVSFLPLRAIDMLDANVLKLIGRPLSHATEIARL